MHLVFFYDNALCYAYEYILSFKHIVYKTWSTDIRDESTFAAVVNEVAKIVGESGLDILINNAGILLPKNKNNSIDDIKKDDMMETYKINAVAPLLLTRVKNLYL